MKAALLEKYDKKNINIELLDVEVPHMGEEELLVRVLAAGVNPLDNMIAHKEVKLIVPYKLPCIVGNEFVGIVEKVGTKVKHFKENDRVFARLPLDKIGSFAEYIAVKEDILAKVPEYLTDIEAAAIPLTALTIMQALELMQVEIGKTIFISGGTGGLGAMAIPIAKVKGLKVITNGSAKNKDRVLALGVDKFIDYRAEDYTKVLSNIDYVLDSLGGEETKKQMTILKKGGKLVSLRAMPNGAFAKRMKFAKWKQILFSFAGHSFDKLAAKYGISYDFIFVEANGRQLKEVAEILKSIRIRPAIDKIYSLEEVNLALEKVAKGGSNGKTVIVIGGEKNGI